LVDVAAERNALMEADRAFYEATAERGVDGWIDFFAEDGRQIVVGTVIEGKGAIRDLMGPAFTSGFALRWTPSLADVGGSGELGYTIGAYESETTTADGEIETGHGTYVTIWKKQADGSWKVVLDIGSEGAGATTEPPGGA
jgi:uncharacterized protein (TIGR02246 family)